MYFYCIFIVKQTSVRVAFQKQKNYHLSKKTPHLIKINKIIFILFDTQFNFVQSLLIHFLRIDTSLLLKFGLKRLSRFFCKF
jgi:hypothetical protein